MLIVALLVVTLAEPAYAFFPIIKPFDIICSNLRWLKKVVLGGADVNETTEKEMTPLMYAVRYSSPEIVIYLIEEGARVNAKNIQSGLTVLMYAVLGNNPEVVEVVLENGAEVNEQGPAGMTALDIAQARWGEDDQQVSSLLKKYGAEKRQSKVTYVPKVLK
ncbi:ankyrin repeat domain-containing protein [Candidatus Omnitrophota bacterium]